MSDARRALARAIARRHLEAGDALGWFEELYSRAQGDVAIIPWGDLEPNPHLIGWLDKHAIRGEGRKALVIGCGLGDDAEAAAHRGFDTTAFDISETAIRWCQRRFPQSTVHYVAADLFLAPPGWEGAFDFVLEAYTIQALPPLLRSQAIAAISRFVRPGGDLLVIARGREPEEPEGNMPWPLTIQELAEFQKQGLAEVEFEDYIDAEKPPSRRFRVLYRREVGAQEGSEND